MTPLRAIVLSPRNHDVHQASRGSQIFPSTHRGEKRVDGQSGSAQRAACDKPWKATSNHVPNTTQISQAANRRVELVGFRSHDHETRENATSDHRDMRTIRQCCRLCWWKTRLHCLVLRCGTNKCRAIKSPSTMERIAANVPDEKCLDPTQIDHHERVGNALSEK
jgi:hypothetical protein